MKIKKRTGSSFHFELFSLPENTSLMPRALTNSSHPHLMIETQGEVQHVLLFACPIVFELPVCFLNCGGFWYCA